MLASLDHPHLARIYDLDIHDGHPFAVMEYVPGQSLDVAAASRRLSAAGISEWVAAAAAAVGHAHRHGIVHRDLKPQNILVGDDGRVRVIDFGLATHFARASDGPDGEGSITGTLRYLSPEQARADPVAGGPPADVFGLGAILYFLLTGSPLYSGGSALDIVGRASRCEWDRSKLQHPSIPPRLRAACEKALAAEPSARFSTADEFAAAIRESPPRRRNARAVAAAALILACGLGLGLWSMRTPPSETPAPTPAVALRQAEIGVRVWDEDRGRYRDLIYRMPAATGERFRYEVEFPAGRHVALFAIDPDGGVRALASARAQVATGILGFPAGPD